MRTGVVELPEHDESLARRVLLEAQFLGVDGFLSAVKAQAYRNLACTAEDWDGSSTRTLQRTFTADSRTRCARMCCRRASTASRAAGSPSRSERKIVQIMPAADVPSDPKTPTAWSTSPSAICLAHEENPRCWRSCATSRIELRLRIRRESAHCRQRHSRDGVPADFRAGAKQERAHPDSQGRHSGRVLDVDAQTTTRRERMLSSALLQLGGPTAGPW